MRPEFGWGPAVSLYVVVAALVAGVAFHFTALGRTFTVTYLDLIALPVAAAGLVAAWRRRAVRVDGVLAAYAALLAVVAVQPLVVGDTWRVYGGASRFVTAALILVGLSQLAPGRDRVPGGWTLPVVGMGGVLGVWTVVLLVTTLAGGSATEFYDLKRALVTPLGASNYLAAFLLVPTVVAIGYAARRRRWVPLAAALTLALGATLSRGAVLGLVAGLVAGAALTRSRRLVAVAATAVALGIVGLVALVATSTGGVVDTPAIATTVTADALATGTPLDVSQAVTPDTGGRLVLYRSAWRAFLDHPWLGVGLNRLETITAASGPPHVNAHNLLLHALATVGLLGTIPYLAVWGLLLWRLWRLPPSTTRTALWMATIALLAHAQVEALAFTRAVEVLLAVLLVVAGAQPGAWGVRTLELRRPVASTVQASRSAA